MTHDFFTVVQCFDIEIVEKVWERILFSENN